DRVDHRRIRNGDVRGGDIGFAVSVGTAAVEVIDRAAGNDDVGSADGTDRAFFRPAARINAVVTAVGDSNIYFGNAGVTELAGMSPPYILVETAPPSMLTLT
ncbi:MAG: hypothetical protein IJW35_07785, partial [Lentisphaeria bacterium]|nr:hypothetical protein [Lentisphaeria bacterium]